MTYDDYTGETLKRCQECRKLKWHEDGQSVCDECRDPTPWCHACGAMQRKHCDCPDPFFADNH